MKKTATKTSATKLPNKARRVALMKLLADEDENVARTIRETILSFGAPARPWLESEALSSDPLLRRRVRDLLRVYEREETDNRFLSFCMHHGEEFDVEGGVWLICKTRYPQINIEAYQAMFDEWAGKLRDTFRAYSRGESRLAIMNEYVFGQLGFSGDEKKYYNPENSYLNRVIDRRMGNPISLCMIYLLLGRRLEMPITGIGFPGHFLCRYQSSKEEYYIDAFNGGKLLSKNQCLKYLKQNGLGVQNGYLVPISARRILLRICANLHQTYLQKKENKEAVRIQRYLVALAK